MFSAATMFTKEHLLPLCSSTHFNRNIHSLTWSGRPLSGILDHFQTLTDVTIQDYYNPRWVTYNALRCETQREAVSFDERSALEIKLVWNEVAPFAVDALISMARASHDTLRRIHIRGKFLDSEYNRLRDAVGDLVDLGRENRCMTVMTVKLDI